MYTTVIVSSLLVLCGAVLSFVKDLYSINKEKKPKIERVFPIAAFVLGLSGVILSFKDSKFNIDSKIGSDSALVVSQKQNDSLVKEQINLLGGGKIKPLFKLMQIDPAEFIFMILDTSKYTMRDFSITLTDEDSLKSFKQKVEQTIKDSVSRNIYLETTTLRNSGGYQQLISFPYLTSNTYRNLQTINVTQKMHLDYIVDMYYTGGSISYYFYFTRLNIGWKKDSIKLYDRLSGVTTFE
jgi:hypothetical protein